MKVDKIVCYIANKCNDIWDMTFNTKSEYNTEVYLFDFCIFVCITLLLIIFVSWYKIPIHYIVSKIQAISIDKYDVKFVCQRSDNNGNNK